ncbi:MAG: YraN family protein [Anaerolineae bacterium]|nr:YraN family protein [Anaerolineae bacterium]
MVEVDIVARLDNIWAFIEVKTRRSANTESAFTGITPQKQQKFIKTVHLYLLNTLARYDMAN